MAGGSEDGAVGIAVAVGEVVCKAMVTSRPYKVLGPRGAAIRYADTLLRTRPELIAQAMPTLSQFLRARMQRAS